MLDAVALELIAVRPDLTSAWGGIEVASDGHPAHFYFYDFCIDSFIQNEVQGSALRVTVVHAGPKCPTCLLAGGGGERTVACTSSLRAI